MNTTNQNQKVKLLKSEIKTILNIPERRILSLGYSCYPKIFLNAMGLAKETELFDINGVDAWGINEILKDNIPSFMDKSLLIDYNIKFSRRRHTGPTTCVTNKKYFIRFAHEFSKNTKLDSNDFNEKYEKIKESYVRKTTRFKTYLSEDQPLIFIYYEENEYNRPVYSEIEQYYPKNDSKKQYRINRSNIEKQSMKDVVNTIQTNYNKQNFVILYFSENLDNIEPLVDIDNKTVYIKVSETMRIKPSAIAPIIFSRAILKHKILIKNAIDQVIS